MLANVLSRYWWTMLLRGVLWILFGIIVFAMPGISLVALTMLFGAFVLVDGITHIGTAIRGRRENDQWWVLLLLGIAGVGVGVLTFLSPGVTALALLFYISSWAVAAGLLEVIAAIRLRREIQGEFWLVLAGIASIAFGLLLMSRPGAGALSVLFLIAGYGIVLGVILIALAFRVRGFAKRLAAINP